MKWAALKRQHILIDDIKEVIEQHDVAVVEDVLVQTNAGRYPYVYYAIVYQEDHFALIAFLDEKNDRLQIQTEFDHPSAYDFPVEWLPRLADTTHQNAQAWRQQVLEKHMKERNA